ncbi:protease s8 tripeptidyl peptidase [Grosmannia clavigera kw1407]|uniref:Protease s8 tripeptidyl peptidase n=1 Tax=Grosmannia clavigera (strain kw1407 / UAMH 11150) TaxID=655863 RepID=F0XQW7_GROCL|nr:protease s8 tripeptidyl peptidase [Grosmannia clavigera kw1407]EFW99720.1 protease s8 tripeptidyl peptidase [Grosmannia clavigera kw1407]
MTIKAGLARWKSVSWRSGKATLQHTTKAQFALPSQVFLSGIAMHLSTLLQVVAVLADGALARPWAPPPSYRMHERREMAHPRLKRRMEADTVLPMRIGLRQNAQSLAQAEAWLMDVSHPTSANFGKHWSAEAVIEAFQPSGETVEVVTAWLVGAGISKERITHSDNKAWLAFDATVAEAEQLLHTEYLHDGAAGQALVGVEQYHLPGHIQEHVDYVTPGVKAVVMDLERRQKRSTTSKKMKAKRVTQTLARNARRKLRPFPRNVGDVTAANLTACDTVLTPACIQALYNFTAPEVDATVSTDNALGIFEEGDHYDQADLNSFYAMYALQVPNGTHPDLDSIDGGVSPIDGDAGGESLLDFTIAYPIIYPQNITLYQTDDDYYANNGNGSSTGLFNTFLDAIDGSYCTYEAYGEKGDSSIDPVYPDTEAPSDSNPYAGKLMCGVYKPTNVISISYGVYEQDQPYAYQERQCNEYLKLALQGTTILFASGDTGVGGYNYGTHGEGLYYGCLGDNDTVFTPSQACSCPWVTNVGATEVFPGKTVFEPEEAVLVQEDRINGNYSSSGGFSNIFGIPSYQAAAIETYFNVSNPPYPYYYDGNWQNATNGGVYNRNGRGIPDVAANGWNYPVPQDGVFYLSGGTSQSAPLFASLLNRIIDERIKIGKGGLGFINPTLYENPGVLNDITKGDNPGCGTLGFSASVGWDPVTGLGTPNYPKMLELFLSLP